MNKKITRWSLMNILFAILVSIPLWSIVVRTGYVLLNKNAYQSYSGTQVVYEKVESQENKVYNFNVFDDELLGWSDHITFYNNLNVLEAKLWDINFAESDNNIDDNYYLDKNYSIETNIRFILYNDLIEIQYNSMYEVDYTTDGFESFYIYDLKLWNGTLGRYEEVYPSELSKFLSVTHGYVEQFVEREITTLDNVFDYSIDKFNSENDAHFDFVTTIANMFITEDSYGWRYVEFVNWYFNYFIVISAVYILFLAIIWFIAVSRRLIERSMNLW